MMSRQIVTGTLCFILVAGVQTQWSYHGNDCKERQLFQKLADYDTSMRKLDLFGPSTWPSRYPHCGGKRQSPVNIDSSLVRYDIQVESLTFDAYDILDKNMVLQNNGVTAKVALSGHQGVRANSTNSVRGTYIAAQFHFHWGSDCGIGSEHSLNSRFYSMSMHVVHYAQKYGGLHKAKTKTDGLAVLALFFQSLRSADVIYSKELRDTKIHETSSDYYGSNSGLWRSLIVNKLPKIINAGSLVDLPPFSLKSLLPENTRHFYVYKGSLTTPPCYETVTLFIFPNPILIGDCQLAPFRHLFANRTSEDREHLVDNFRPLQPLNGRQIYSSF